MEGGEQPRDVVGKVLEFDLELAHRQTDTHTHPDTRTHTEADMHTYTQRQTDRQTHTHTHMHTQGMDPLLDPPQDADPLPYRKVCLQRSSWLAVGLVPSCEFFI